MLGVAKIFRALASEHSCNFCEQFEQRPNFASTINLNGTIRYPYPLLIDIISWLQTYLAKKNKIKTKSLLRMNGTRCFSQVGRTLIPQRHNEGQRSSLLVEHIILLLWLILFFCSLDCEILQRFQTICSVQENTPSWTPFRSSKKFQQLHLLKIFFYSIDTRWQNSFRNRGHRQRPKNRNLYKYSIRKLVM